MYGVPALSPSACCVLDYYVVQSPAIHVPVFKLSQPGLCTLPLCHPLLLIVCRSPQLTVNLPGGVAYCAVDTSLPAGAPLRTVTVRDAITDLPPIENGHSE